MPPVCHGVAKTLRVGMCLACSCRTNRSAAFTPLQRWTISERLGIHEPRVSADVEAASRPRSFSKALNRYPGWRRRPFVKLEDWRPGRKAGGLRHYAGGNGSVG